MQQPLQPTTYAPGASSSRLRGIVVHRGSYSYAEAPDLQNEVGSARNRRQRRLFRWRGHSLFPPFRALPTPYSIHRAATAPPTSKHAIPVRQGAPRRTSGTEHHRENTEQSNLQKLHSLPLDSICNHSYTKKRKV